MRRGVRVSILPAAAGVAALFLVLPQRGAQATVTMVASGPGWAFSPASLRVEPGARVGFTNRTRVTHTATHSGGAWDTGDVQPGQTVFVTLPSEQGPAELFGSGYAYACRYHGASLGMSGALLLGPQATVTLEPIP